MNTSLNVDPLSFFARMVLVRLLIFVGIAGLALAGVVVAIYFQERNYETLLLSQQGQQRVDEEEEFLADEVDSVRSDVLYLAEQPLILHFLENPAGMRQEVEQEYVRFAKLRSIYDQIRFLNLDGQEEIRINYRKGKPQIVASDQLQEKTDRYYFLEALKLEAGDVFISRFDLNVEHGQIERPIEPVLRFVTPVFDRQGERRGLLTLNYSGNHLLRRLSDATLPGSMLLVNASGHYIQGPTPDDAWGWILGHSRTFSDQFPKAWEKVSMNRRGLAVTSEGVFAYRHVSSVPSSSVREDEHALMLIAYVPAKRQHANSRKLLKQLLWMYGGAMLFLVGFGWVWARSAAIREHQAKSIQASEARLRALSDQLLTAQEEERRSISRELHDEMGQQVTAISLDLQSALRQAKTEETGALVERAIAETDQLLHSIHQFASRVRPAVLDDLGLHDALQSLVTEIGQRSKLAIATRLDFDEDDLSPKIIVNTYRMVQEALLNVVKHARAERASIEVVVDERRLFVRVSDSGVGFDPQQCHHSRLGLLGLQERAELLDGEFRLDSQPNEGTRIEVSIPLRQS